MLGTYYLPKLFLRRRPIQFFTVHRWDGRVEQLVICFNTLTFCNWVSSGIPLFSISKCSKRIQNPSCAISPCNTFTIILQSKSLIHLLLVITLGIKHESKTKRNNGEVDSNRQPEVTKFSAKPRSHHL